MSKVRIVHLVNITLIIASAFSVNSFFSYKNYNIYDTDKWESSKTRSAKALLAAWAMVLTKPGLSQNHLNIGAWHGYQELIYKNPVKYATIGFRCKSFAHPFSFIINKTDTGSTGIYFNYLNDTCCFFTTDAEGKFIQKNNFAINNALNNNEWNDITCQLKENNLCLSINNRTYAITKTNIHDSIHTGFRGSRKDVYIDDICISDNSQNKVVLDNFTPPFKLHWQTFLFLIIMFVCYSYLPKNQKLNFILLNIIILLSVLLYYYIYFNNLSALYPLDPNPAYLKRIDCKIEGPIELNYRMEKQYPLNTTAGKKPIILTVGSSQTYGAGVSNLCKAYPYHIEGILRTYFNDSSITVINTGICGFTSERLLSLYKSRWINYKPMLTIIDLSSNDFDTSVFRKSIRSFIKLNQAQNIKTLLILEPNDTISDRLLYNHGIMKSEAMSTNIPFQEEQLYMDSCSNSGFLWWDFVHMTDYGYHIFADRVSQKVIEVIESDSSLHTTIKTWQQTSVKPF